VNLDLTAATRTIFGRTTATAVRGVLGIAQVCFAGKGLFTKSVVTRTKCLAGFAIASGLKEIVQVTFDAYEEKRRREAVRSSVAPLEEFAESLGFNPDVAVLAPKLDVEADSAVILEEVRCEVAIIAEGTLRTLDGFRDVKRRLMRKWEDKGLTASEILPLIRMAKLAYFTVSVEEAQVNAYIGDIRVASSINVTNHFNKTGTLNRSSAFSLWWQDCAVTLFGDWCRYRADIVRSR
jgi:hypothetical protein